MTDWDFILRTLRYAKMDYQNKTSKYFQIEGYKETIYFPTLKEFDDAIESIRKLKAEATQEIVA